MTRPIEPGILPLFRLFVALELLLLLLRAGLETVFRADFPLVPSPWAGLVFLALLLGYLSWPRLEEHLRSFYLPIALVLSVAATLAAAAAGIKLRLATGIRAEELVRGSWILIVVLLVPLILVAWQYGFRRVLWFCLLTVAAELALTLPLAAGSGSLPPALVVLAFVRSFFFVPVGYAVARIVDAQRRQREALAEANARLARYAATLEQLAISRERNRLAHELHDTLAHGLSSVAVQLEAVSALWESQAQTARAMLAEALVTTRTALGEARRAIVALRASPLEDLGLAGAIRQLAESAATSAGLALDLQVPAAFDGLDSETEHAFYRIAAESGHLKDFTFELGGKNPMVIYPDADAEKAFTSAVHGMNFYQTAGQSCGSTSRIFIHRSLYEQAKAAIKAACEAIRIGEPQDPDTLMAGLSTQQQFDKTLRYIELSKREGLPLLTGWRGSIPKDVQCLKEVLLRFSALVDDFAEISEMEINPLMVFDSGKGCAVVDARIFVKGEV